MRCKKLSILVVVVILLSLPFTLATSVDRVVQASASPGDTVPVRFNVVMDQSEDYYVLNDRIPAGWNVSSVGGGSVGADGIWRLTVNPAVSSSGTEGYDLDVPLGADGLYTFSGTYGTVGGSGGPFSGSIGGSSSLSSVGGLGTVVSLAPASQSIQEGNSFTVDVYVSGAVNLYGVQFDLTFDDSVLTLQNVASNSELLGLNIGGGQVTGSDLLGDPYYIPGSGLVDDFVVLRSGIGTGVTSDGGRIATLTFTTDGPSGSVNLALQNVLLVDPDGGSLTHSTQTGVVEVGFCGDGTTQPGLGETCDDGNTDNGDGCSAVCTNDLCGVNVGADSCTAGEICSGSSVDSADSATCCSVQCSPPSWATCGECGTGIFNVCDRNECENLIFETCFFVDDGVPGNDIGSCEGCPGATCGDYDVDPISCASDVCGLAPPSCVFNSGGGICEVATNEIDCTDGIDNDGDTLTDCLDPDCFGLEGPNPGVMCCGVVSDCTNQECSTEQCVSNECIYTNRPQGDYTECGECEACDAAGGSCAAVVLADEGSQCSGECTYCSFGSCTPRSDGDFAECTGECEACSGGACTAGTYPEGALCEDPGKYCSAGNCCNDINGDNLCDSCSLDEECDSPYTCAVGVCQGGSCDLDISGCDCSSADTNQDGQWNVNDLSFIVLNPSDPRSNVDGAPGVNIGDLVFVATRIGICST